MDINIILFIISLIVFLGYLAEWAFKKINVPDTLILIAVGFILRGSGLGITPESLGAIAPLFTTFTLLFLMFDGALYIDLRSLTEGFGSGIAIGFTGFITSAIAIAAIFFFLVHDVMLSLMLGFALGGISSAFVIPILKQLSIEKKIYSVLTLESALTDVFSIVFAITMIELQVLNMFRVKSVLTQVASLFFVAGFLGVIAGALWIFLEDRLMEKDRNYMMTIAYVVLLYFLTEYLGGNGAIAAMTFGIMIANSRIMADLASRIKRKPKASADAPVGEKPVNVVSRRERLFYEEIAFFVKTFFFVYIGLLLNFTNYKAILAGTGIAFVIMLLRNLVSFLTQKYKKENRVLINSLFARGIAPAAIILIALEKNLITDPTIVDTVYFVITATIIFSSIRVFMYKRKLKKKPV